MTLQEIYTKVVTHLHNQMAVSLGGNGEEEVICQYNGFSHMTCAVGCLITPRYYSHHLEGHTPADGQVQSALIKSGVLTDWETNEQRRDKVRLLTELQTIHDCFYARPGWEWKATVPKLLERGQHFGLVWPRGVPHA